MKNPIILIPARLAATRLPNKPLADICGLPMVVQVLRRAEEADIAPVVVACAEQEIVEAVEKAGGRAILTDPALPSGSDRIFSALGQIDPEGLHDCVINLQGDMPTLAPDLVKQTFDLLKESGADIATLASLFETVEEAENPHAVKAILDIAHDATSGRALYFSRNIAPSGEGPLFHHIGLYAYTREALARFVSAPPSHLEKREKLEQLRALAMGMHIACGITNAIPFGVDTYDDLQKARILLAQK
ncbi:MAG TPA: 3-deoxy-manno-octulosonate cytidylyltransferase [Rhodospirillaceae bacterium]|nr:MAG: 3-deoxy-manno-octulosonate cytidylyltransferase [Alphaproteobacteria bacterium GWF2_58_20]HAU29638.1 3-deoxy-manno-octulosonate cytidylyltransferase [Rhodospirillaceae bacterium]